LLACVTTKPVIISRAGAGKQRDSIVMHDMGIAAKQLLGRILAGIFSAQ
jgi:hypothetical protein